MPIIQPPPAHDPGIIALLIAQFSWLILAIAGGVARYLDEYARNGQPFKIGQLVVNAFVSGFSGYMVAQLTLKFNADWALIAAGIGGYLGTQALEEVRKIFFMYVNARASGRAEHENKEERKDD